MAKLNAQDLEKFHGNLKQLRAQIMNELDRIKGDTLKKSSRESSGDLSGYSLHMADQASDNYDREFILNLANSEQEILYKIEEAMKRIEDKTYGVCPSCEKAIAKARLKAMPFALLCVPCQEKEESGISSAPPQD